MSVRAWRERQEQFERERAVVRMRAAVLSAVALTFEEHPGSSAVGEAVDEALAQLVAVGDHLGDPDAVKALWVMFARRRLIDERRSAEARHRDGAAVDEAADALVIGVRHQPTLLTEDERQWSRIREILGVLRGDQRIWAEAWYDRVLSGSHESKGRPHGLPEALGWSPGKTKSVARRARARMAAFIDDRVSGVVCDEQRALMDEVIVASRQRAGADLDPGRHEAVLLHVAGCEDCWAAWHARRRALLGRCTAVLAVPIDGVVVAAQTVAAKLFGLAVGGHSQGQAVLARSGLGGAAAAGGGAATIGAKATAVCVGVVCAATAGGELVGVLPPISRERPHDVRSMSHPKRVSNPTRRVAAHVAPSVAVVAAARRPVASSTPAKTAPARKRRRVPAPGFVARAAHAMAHSSSSGSSFEAMPPANPQSAAATPEFVPTSRAGGRAPAAEFGPATSTCASGSTGC